MRPQFESGFFVGDNPWNEVGEVLNCPPTVEEAINVSGLNWKVEEKDLGWFEFGTPGINQIASHKALLRDTDNKLLGVVGKDYTPLQNEEVFKFFNPILESGEADLDTAGCLRGGKTVFVLAKLKDGEAEVLKDDPVQAYLLLYNSHDGSLAVGVQFTSIRIVCWNTLTTAFERGKKGREDSIRLKHTRGLKHALSEVRRSIDASRRTFSLSLDAYRHISKKSFKDSNLDRYVREIFEVEDDQDTPRALKDIRHSYHIGRGQNIPGVQGTYWGAFNAVTDWLDHHRGRTLESSIYSSWFGDSRRVRQRALDIALNA